MKEEIGNGEGPTPKDIDGENGNYEERKSRPSTANRSSRREEVALEKVSVEMSPLEQEMYALMGVSPLIRLDKEFKDPKSVLIEIAVPGENNSKKSTKPKLIEETVDSVELKTAEKESLTESEANVVEDSQPKSSEPTLENEDASTNRRRRRRRSSAQKELEAQV